MKGFTFETQGTRTYLIYSVGDEVLDNMSVGMLTSNHIDGFLPTTITQLDVNRFIKYDISAKISAKEFLSGYVTRKRLLGVFSGVVHALFSAEEYMLDPSTVVLDTEYMYSDVATGETKLICLPIVNAEKLPVQPANFFKDVISNIQCDPTENCDYFAKILNYLNGSAIFSLADFGELLNTLAKEVVSPPSYSSKPVGHVTYRNFPASLIAPVVPPSAPMQEPKPIVLSSVPKQEPKPIVSSSVPKQEPKPVVPPSAPTKQPQMDKDANEKEMSLLYLLRHCNSENLAAYKAQKEDKKSKNSSAPIPTPAKPEGNMGFAIPGQSAPIQSASIKSAPVQDQKSVASEPAPCVQPAEPVAKPSMNFGETVVVNNIESGTVVIGAAASQVKSPCLIRVKTNEKIPLVKPVVRLGRARGFVDFCIQDNPAVSQSHANVFNRSGVCFITDTNSTNHTYVNGVMLSAGVEKQLNEGDKIHLGNEEFEFKFC